MQTALASWGNSSAIRIPKVIMKSAGLSVGDVVDVSLNSTGKIEISPVEQTHRMVEPAKDINFEVLFAGYTGPQVGADAWPDDDMVGAEAESWRS